MQRLLICCCLLAATVRGMEASTQDDRDHEMVRLREDNDQDYHYDLQPSAVDMRIVGGRAITNEKLGGYIVAMWYNRRFVCGGTLIKDDIVLTAAHCFRNRRRRLYWDLFGGITVLDGRGKRRRIKDFALHSYYRFGQHDWDVAVVRLNWPMVGWNIKTLSLCTTKLKEGMQVHVSGWGKTSDRFWWHERYLRYITVPIIDWQKCQQAFSSTRVVLTKSMLCAGVLGLKDSCTYDSGGPLAYNKEVCGITSFGIGCATRRFPGVYTDVYAVRPFIEEAMRMLLARR